MGSKRFGVPLGAWRALALTVTLEVLLVAVLVAVYRTCGVQSP